MKKGMRTGYTTGSCAAAASRAALRALKGGGAPGEVEIALPRGGTLRIPVHSCSSGADSARCIVVKDGGDDPDVTHGAEIVVDLSLTGEAGGMEIKGGEGVGTVTKPGLGLEIGAPAINPVPRRMIEENLRAEGLPEGRGASVTISVPRGRELAPRTDNPRIGIRGGISILGTSGIVVPFSTASYAASIRQGLDVAVATGHDTVVLATGGRSEECARGVVDLPEQCFVQMGDFAGYTMQQCAKKGIKKAYVVGFVGKFAKMAAGTRQTHVKGSKVDTGLLARLAREAGAGEGVAAEVGRANTARHAAEIIQGAGVDGFFGRMCGLVRGHMAGHAGGEVEVEAVLFDFGGGVLARA